MRLRNSQPVLITGKTGVGKTRLAKSLHKEAWNSQEKFVQINVAAITENLFESELFGHVRGAFSGAISDKKGYLEVVGSGTLFLDEIGELTLAQQAKLLTVMDEGTYYPVGSYTAKTFKGRFFYATNRNLSEMVTSGEFREDLFYRIRVNEIRLKSLNEYENKVELIMKEISLAKRNMQSNVVFPEEILNLLFSYNWPGNFRELKHTLESIIHKSKTRVNFYDLPHWVSSEKGEVQTNEDSEYYKNFENFEKNLFQIVLTKNYGLINQSAIEMGISKVTLISKLKKYGIDRRYFKVKNKLVG